MMYWFQDIEIGSPGVCTLLPSDIANFSPQNKHSMTNFQADSHQDYVDELMVRPVVS